MSDLIRVCDERDFDAIFEIINDAAQAYKGVIPADRWHEPYMARSALEREIGDGVGFWAMVADGLVVGVMGVQDKDPVALIRHAYVKTAQRRQGIGSRLLRFLQARTEKPMLIGTWRDAGWAITFYEKHGFRVLPDVEARILLGRFWNVPERQMETSVVLAPAGMSLADAGAKP